MLNLHGRAAVARVLAPLGERLGAAGVNPDAVTIVGTIGFTASAVWLLSTGHFVAGPIVCTVWVLSDLIDGLVARHRGVSSVFGAFLDSSLDRVADGAAFASLAYWFFTRGQSPLVGAVALVALVAGNMTSYVKARAEGLGLTANVGIVERAERLIIVGVGTLLQGITGVSWLSAASLWVLAVLSLVTVGQRLVEVHRQAGLVSDPVSQVPPVPPAPALAR